MNDRIQALAEQSDITQYVDADNKYLERFAELIVQECATVAWRNTPDTEELEYSHLIKDKILEHFGVDE